LEANGTLIEQTNIAITEMNLDLPLKDLRFSTTLSEKYKAAKKQEQELKQTEVQP